MDNRNVLQAVHLRKPTNILELKLCCTKDWAEIPQFFLSEALMNSYWKCLVAVQRGLTADVQYLCHSLLCNTEKKNPEKNIYF